MKFLPTLFAALSLVSAPSVFAATESVNQIMEDAQRAMARGDLATAKKNFQIVVEVDPKNQVAKNFLRNIIAQEANQPKGPDMEKQLSAVIMPKLEFKEATLGSVFEFIRQQVPKVTGGKTSVNFVLAVPDQQLSSQPITLQLANIPLTEALRYLSDLSGLQMEYQRYAIKVSPKAGSTFVPAAGTPTAPVTPAVPGQ